MIPIDCIKTANSIELSNFHSRETALPLFSVTSRFQKRLLTLGPECCKRVASKSPKAILTVELLVLSQDAKREAAEEHDLSLDLRNTWVSSEFLDFLAWEAFTRSWGVGEMEPQHDGLEKRQELDLSWKSVEDLGEFSCSIDHLFHFGGNLVQRRAHWGVSFKGSLSPGEAAGAREGEGMLRCHLEPISGL